MKARRAMTDAGATPRELGAAQTHTGCVTRRHSPLLARWTGQHQESWATRTHTGTRAVSLAVTRHSARGRDGLHTDIQ